MLLNNGDDRGPGGPERQGEQKGFMKSIQELFNLSIKKK